MILKEILVAEITAGRNIRQHAAPSNALVSTVRKLGVLNPITVQKIDGGKYETVTGMRRFEAAKAAKLRTIPAIVKKTNEHERLLQQLVENIQREDLHPLDEAEAVAQLLTLTGESQLYISRLIGKSESWVSQTLGVLRLSKEEKDALRAMPKPPAKQTINIAVVTRDPKLRQSIVAGEYSRHKAQKAHRKELRHGGRPRHFVLNLTTTKAIVSVRFRCHRVTRADVIAALAEASSYVAAIPRWSPRR